MPPIWGVEDPSMQRQPFDMPIYLDLISDPPRLPRMISFLNDGFYRTYNPATKLLDVFPLAPPYDNGYTNAIYRVLDVTNSGAVQIPTRFAFVQYTSPISPGSTPFERIFVRGVSDRITASLLQIEPPDFQGSATVADFRAHSSALSHGKAIDIPYAAYPIKNSAWVSSNQLAAIRSNIEAKVQIRLRLQQLSTNSNASRSREVTVALLLVGTLPLVYIFWRVVRRNTKSH